MAITMDYLAFRGQYGHIAMMSNLLMNKHVLFYSKCIQPGQIMGKNIISGK